MPPETDHRWRVVAYEVRMFAATYEVVLDLDAMRKLAKVLQNSVEESAVLHTRILCDIFLSRADGDDDIRLDLLFPDLSVGSAFEALRSRLQNLRRRYGSASRVGSSCWIINKMMAHPTTHRGESYDYTNILASLRTPIQKIIDEVETLRGVPFSWNW